VGNDCRPALDGNDTIFRRKRMPLRKDPKLKDMERQLIEGRLDALRGELATAYDFLADRLLGTNKAAEPNSVKAIPGGRPESNRRKF
jgi:hypothetical protein